jgi:hypothetical protein
MLKLEIDEYRAETERLKEQWAAKIGVGTMLADGTRAESAVLGAMVKAAQPVAGTVTTGEQELPNVGGQQAGQAGGAAIGGAADMSGLEQKLDQLAAMVGQLVQGMGGQQQMQEPIQPPSAPVEPPM